MYDARNPRDERASEMSRSIRKINLAAVLSPAERVELSISKWGVFRGLGWSRYD